MHSKHRYKISICSVILSELESFRNYSETLPFGHTFSCKKSLVNTAKFFWPVGACYNGVPLVHGLQYYFSENFRCNVSYYESENFSDSSLDLIFESENFRFPFLSKNRLSLGVECVN